MFDQIIETNGKKVSIQITNKGKVILKKPKKYKKELLDKFIESKQKWIEENKQKILQNLQQNHNIINGLTILINGREVPLIMGAKLNKIEEDFVEVKSNKALVTMLKKYALEKITEKGMILANKIGVNPAGFSIENTRTRWGACSSKKQIKINFRVIMLEEKYLNYILIHELTHLKEFNHSSKFWDIVKKHEPKYSEYKKQLKNYSFLLELYR